MGTTATNSGGYMLAYHGRAELKTTQKRRVSNSHTATMRLARRYSAQRQGLHKLLIGKDNPELYESALGIPEPVAHILERLFMALPSSEATWLPSDFFLAIPVGADLSLVPPKLIMWMLSDRETGARAHIRNNVVLTHIARVCLLYDEWTKGTRAPYDEWEDALIRCNGTRRALGTELSSPERNELTAHHYHAMMCCIEACRAGQDAWPWEAAQVMHSWAHACNGGTPKPQTFIPLRDKFLCLLQEAPCATDVDPSSSPRAGDPVSPGRELARDGTTGR